MPRAAIDIGSHSFLLTLVTESGDVLWDERQVVQLGQGVGDAGSLRPERMKRAWEVLGAFIETCAIHGVDAQDIHACATSAVRRATNGPAWTQEILKSLGLTIHVASGLEEAELTFFGALHGLPPFEGHTWAIDIGGGSAEIARGRAGRLLDSTSTPLGAARQAEDCLPPTLAEGRVSPRGVESLKVRAKELLEANVHMLRHKGAAHRGVAVGGTATTLLALHLGHEVYAAASLHGRTLRARDIDGLAGQLLTMTHAERVAWLRFAPDRADTLLAGAVILGEILRHLKLDNVTISTRGLRYGLLLAQDNA